MDYALSEQQQAFRETAERFARQKLAPHYQKRARQDRIDRAMLKEMGELGLIGADLPEKYGGLGESSVTTGIIIEQIAYGDFNASYVQLLASLMGGMIAKHASPGIADEWLPRVTGGEAIIGLGLTEPRGGSDAANLILRAEKSGFKTLIRRQIELHVQQAARIDLQFEVGDVVESVQVQADAALLATDNATVGTVIENRRIVELPLNGRNYLQLVSLAPNVSTGFAAQGQAGARQGFVSMMQLSSAEAGVRAAAGVVSSAEAGV